MQARRLKLKANFSQRRRYMIVGRLKLETNDHFRLTFKIFRPTLLIYEMENVTIPMRKGNFVNNTVLSIRLHKSTYRELNSGCH